MNRLDDFEQRLAKIEAVVDTRPAIRFAGPFKDDTPYPAGSVTQFKGALFIAVRDAEPGRMPGDAEDDRDGQTWRLAVRRGRDGRDADVRALELRIKRLEQQR